MLQVLSVLHSNQVQRRGVGNLTVISTMYYFSEPLVESIPQLFVMFFIISNNINGDTIAFDDFFWFSFVSSLFSSAFALAKLLKVGPCQVMPRDKFGITFLLIFFCNTFGLMGRGFILHTWYAYTDTKGFGTFYGPMIYTITSILPPMIFVSKLPIDYFLSLFSLKKLPKLQQFINLAMNQGFKKALQTAKDYPSILLLPAFSIWTYGSIEKGSCQNCQSSQKIGLSFSNSCLNGLYTLCVSVTAAITHISFYGLELFNRNLRNLTFSAEKVDELSMILVIPVNVASIILMSVVACMDTCSCCSCSCCCDCLLPMTERTANTFGLPEEAPTEIPLVETNPPASPNNETTTPLLIPLNATIHMH